MAKDGRVDVAGVKACSLLRATTDNNIGQGYEAGRGTLPPSTKALRFKKGCRRATLRLRLARAVS
jgi:hypothetical protein